METETIIDLLTTYWQFTLVAALIVLAFVVNRVLGKKVSTIGFSYKETPMMTPISIPTKGKGFWGAIWLWLMVSRTWEITKDFHYTINNEPFVIPKGFVFDGASVPKFLRTWLSPMGVLLIGGLVHDYGYKYQTLLRKGKKTTNGLLSQQQMDTIFRDINVEVNGFRFINYLAYYALRLGGFVAWKGHRKNNLNWK